MPEKKYSTHRAIKQKFFIVSLMLFLGPIFYFPSYAEDLETSPISLCKMNTPTGLARIRNGYFRTVFRGFGSFTDGLVPENELQGFRYLTQTDCLSRGLTELIQKKTVLEDSQIDRLEKAKVEHAEFLLKNFCGLDTLKNFYENRPGKWKALASSGLFDSEPHFIFSSPHLAVAKLYGPVVMIIQESSPRGIDLNSMAYDQDYYSSSRLLRNIIRQEWGILLADHLEDLGEYVIPSFTTPEDVRGILVYNPSPIKIGSHLLMNPEAPLLRVYRKYHRKGSMVIDIFDGKFSLIARLSANPRAAVIEKQERRSLSPMPGVVALAWETILKGQK